MRCAGKMSGTLRRNDQVFPVALVDIPIGSAGAQATEVITFWSCKHAAVPIDRAFFPAALRPGRGNAHHRWRTLLRASWRCTVPGDAGALPRLRARQYERNRLRCG